MDVAEETYKRLEHPALSDGICEANEPPKDEEDESKLPKDEESEETWAKVAKKAKKAKGKG